MGIIFMNSENSKTSKPHVLILKLTNKLDLRIGDDDLIRVQTCTGPCGRNQPKEAACTAADDDYRLIKS